ncbi:fimbrial protein [Stenotrophomonas sp. PFBMAA-4]|uniref:fimbrial protein n=1 Tax=Stenotrophomonas sp. PFBMAA-4 TaxID=3043301 RepID=UPI0024B61642|nr:fimbrial protein [Stenotrophomonas sp. PFBMAA-4]MDI9273899.1 fimbrial protein [Stenotrophomonas sp. PFBMAA-4]
MKAQHLVLVALLFGAATRAHADSATLTFTGNVLPGTCTVTPNVAVTLDDIQLPELRPGNVNLDHQKPAVLHFTNCVGVSTVEVTFDGTADPTQGGQWKNLAVGGATNVAVILLEGASGNTTLSKGMKRMVAIGGAAIGRLDMRTSYYNHPGTVPTPGDVTAQITVIADYR